MTDPSTAPLLDLPPSGWLASTPKVRLGPALGTLTTIALLSLFALSVFVAPRSPDYFWSIATGHWTASHSLFTTGHLSFALTNHHVVVTEWGYDVLIYALYSGLGSAGTGALMVLLSLAAFAMTAWYLSRARLSRARALTGALVYAAVLIPFIPQGRALSFSLVFLPLLLGLLHVSRSRPRWLLTLPPLFLLWVNIHGSVLLGLGILTLELGWSLVSPSKLPSLGGRSRHRLGLAIALGASLVASCITPWGPALVWNDLKFTNNATVNQLITEWHSPNFHNTIYLFTVTSVIVVLCIAARRRAAPALETTAAAVLLLAWLHSARSLPYVALPTIALACVVMPQLKPHHALRAAAFAAGASCSLLASVAYALPLNVPSPSTSPAQAFAYLNHHDVTSRVLTTYAWSGYELFSGRQSFVDGRTYLFAGNHLLKTYENVATATSPDAVLSKYHVRYVLWPSNSPLARFLGTDSGWHIIYHRGTVDVFEHNSVKNYHWPRGLIVY